MASWYHKLATGDAPFAPLTNPAYWATGGGSPSTIQDPNRLPRRGDGTGVSGSSVFAPSDRPRTRTDVPYATQRAPTGETREQHDAYNAANFPNAGKGTWSPSNNPLNFRSTAPDKLGAPAVPPTDANTTPGSESGPGILEDRYNKRANGTDPAFEYASKRGMDQLFDRYSAMGLGNSGAARQGESDFMANLVAQSQAQIDALAGGASGEHQRKIDSMFDNLFKEGSGRAGTSGIYDTGASDAWGKSLEAMILMALNKAGVDSQSNREGIQNLAGLSALFA